MILTDTFEPGTREAWRAWLQARHAESKGVWLVFLKQHTGQAALTYREALEEALCFGWIDGVRQRIDELRYAQRFTPRTPASRWSEVNKAIAASLEAQGRMRPAGLAWREAWSTPAPPAAPQGALPPEGFEAALQAHPVAWVNFMALPPSHQRRYLGWIGSAKREETRVKRVAEAVALLLENKRIGLGPGEVRK
ncbi:YdeI/OmpD-associated family protein [Mesoterricola sediminis]|uniref:Bacteriocin-protection protein n=1 Tax=Mesoterricola sediminis TaxID=2927980 RepID=A0AA48GXC0_9BACT|nr:YdeI/OmpD-associated family protein [Mesoterricola sediminis]BDU76110.1 hypothetical protein METESE_10680 [Mesoterricola sediminis]